jgi:hypothetical protein
VWKHVERGDEEGGTGAEGGSSGLEDQKQGEDREAGDQSRFRTSLKLVP